MPVVVNVSVAASSCEATIKTGTANTTNGRMSFIFQPSESNATLTHGHDTLIPASSLTAYWGAKCHALSDFWVNGRKHAACAKYRAAITVVSATIVSEIVGATCQLPVAMHQPGSGDHCHPGNAGS